MAKLSPREKQAVMNAFATVSVVAADAQSAERREVVMRSAGGLLWLLKLPEVTIGGMTFVAMPPEDERAATVASGGRDDG